MASFEGQLLRGGGVATFEGQLLRGRRGSGFFRGAAPKGGGVATFEGQFFLKGVGMGEWLLSRGSCKGGGVPHF